MQALKGTHDILPSEVYKWDYMESVLFPGALLLYK